MPEYVYELALSGEGEDNNANGDLDILRSITIYGGGADTTIISGHSLDRVLHVHAGVEVEISGVTIMGGKNSGRSGAFRRGSTWWRRLQCWSLNAH